MNSEVKAKWIAALRSGEYKQGHGKLRVGDKFCCLGVLCDLHAREGVNPEDGWDFTGSMTGSYLEHGRVNYPPLPVLRWAGLHCDSNPLVQGHSLSDHNDGDGTTAKTFPEIADLIQAHL